jgi:hypothetical protein
MTLFILIVVIAIIGYVAMNIYLHDNSSFYKLTGYSYFDLVTKKKVRMTYKLVKAIEITNGPQKILVNLQVPSNGELHEIDAVLLHETGIYVINVKEMTGWINGREQDIHWTQLLHGNKSNLFDNPIHETKRLKYALQDQLPEVDENLFDTLVIFTNDCSFQQIEMLSEDTEVIKVSELKKWGSTLNGEKRLSQTEIETLYASLESMMNVKNTTFKLQNSVA